MKSFLLDTHIWIWYVDGSETLGKAIQKTITKAIHDGKAYVAAISLWEIAMLNKKKRIIVEMPCLEWINKSIAMTRMQVIPITPEIATESCYLPDGFHEDPADRLIAATARVKGLTLVTRDARILAYGKQKLISVLKG